LRFHQHNARTDIDEAVAMFNRAVALLPDDHPGKLDCLNSLGVSHRLRFERFSNPSDIEYAITILRQVANRLPDGHPNKHVHLSDLGLSILHRFERSGDPRDIDDAVVTMKSAVLKAPKGHPKTVACFGNLGKCLRARSEHSGNVQDLEDALKAIRHAVGLVNNHQPWLGPDYLIPALNNLSASLCLRFTSLGNPTDLKEAIEVSRCVIQASPSSHHGTSDSFHNLATCLLSSSLYHNNASDLDEAILACQHAIELVSDNNPRKPEYLNNLANCLQARFDRAGKHKDIDEAVVARRQAVDLTPKKHTRMPNRLGGLATTLACRFEWFNDSADIQSAIDDMRRAIGLAPDLHISKPLCHGNLGSFYFIRWSRLHNLEDLQNAVTELREAVRLTPSDHPDRPSRLSNLGLALGSQTRQLSNTNDINEAIECIRHAVELTPKGHSDEPFRYSALGSSLRHRFERLGDLDDVNEAIVMHRQAVDLTPDDHPNKSDWLFSLGNGLQMRFGRLKNLEDFDAAFQCYIESATCEFSPPSTRLRAAQRCAEMFWANCDLVTNDRFLQVYECALPLIAQVAWLGHDIIRRYDELSHLDDITNAAAAVAIAAGRLSLAVEWLEEGRSVVWGQLLQLRTPLKALEKKHPGLAAQLQRISQSLEVAGHMVLSPKSTDINGQIPARPLSVEREVVRRRALAEEYKTTLAAVRAQQGFERFLLPKKLTELAPAPEVGPVVMINVHKSRCDALIVFSGPHVIPVHLPKLTAQLAGKMCATLVTNLRATGIQYRDETPLRTSHGASESIALPQILGRLWTLVVQPVPAIFNRDRLPHVTWCATGPLTFLPLHAAGIYPNTSSRKAAIPTGHADKAFELIVSSYTPTLSALSRSSTIPSLGQTESRMVIVSQSKTCGLKDLPGAKKEVQNIKEHIPPNRLVHLSDDAATVAAVLDAIDTYHPQFLHLACHGIQNPHQATMSAFRLHDDSLPLSLLMTKTMHNAELAFLSACQTATGDESLPDEAVHLAAGMLAVGFKGVIGTMWSIHDQDAPLIAGEVYKQLSERGGDANNLRVAYALHDAVGRLRDKVKENNFVRWVPFVHFGL
ncbi:CHAT domain-containing protein, partial [Vararia minispora EC-137]